MAVELKSFDSRILGESPEVRRLSPPNAPYYLPIREHGGILPIKKGGESMGARGASLRVLSYTPGTKTNQKNPKLSPRQRFITIEFDYPPADKETAIIEHEAAVSADIAGQLALLGEKVRNLKASGLEEGVSTRLLIYAGELVCQGAEPRRAAT